ncbi:hypothetical protein G7054_g10233 [Neopestalotiopsis clavispora]|nr:hypothetical protein G7054_g10233 [Neopestalotiopsis clavispora]
MLWCYSSTAEMTDKSSTTRLSLIETELLKRSGRGIGDIVELSKSQCFGQDLVIVNESGLEKFEGTLQDIRMLQNSINSPSKDLSEEFCFRLQAFLRLQTKLKWTIRDLDAAIFLMRLREIEFSGSDAPPSDSSSIFISSFIFKEIASIVELSSLTGADTASLLPLWGILDAHGEKSFLRRKFFTSGIRLDKISKIFTPPIDCMPLTIDGKPARIRDEKILISMSLDWPVDKFLDLFEVVNLDEIGEALDMAKFSALYRHVLICQILGVRPSCCKQFFKLFYSQSKRPLDRPTITISAIKAWKSVLDTDWNITALEDFLSPAEAETSTGVQRVAIVCQVYGLDIDELTYLANDKISSHSVPQLDLNTPTLYLLAKLQKYADFKQKCQARSQGKSIIALLQWLSTAVDVDTQEIANEIAAATGWDNIRLKEAMDIKYEGYASTQMVVLLRSIDELLNFETIMSIHQELSFEARVQSEPSMYDLFCFAQTRCSTSFEGDAKVLDDIRARLTLA